MLFSSLLRLKSENQTGLVVAGFINDMAQKVRTTTDMIRFSTRSCLLSASEK
ncbi:uncharacterized protein MYCGRDRAFT_106227 [Zymoseptoria tritici IPO323]|uniref:Uncharacterized protein n=1 Tax=Zymoseptoria tritici (strain CBS 115943 / IPO323) TaxID=336722 RepID=F9XM73_ZYMTI|nr:uncharacterized protein MYCGRDRAFT_106227 [Zymoseptoria tritici IPO323]EGP83436.1 hypothetical protein MYCGRDRAFT_106227 [Zymoseptoria tritici IPO323]